MTDYENMCTFPDWLPVVRQVPPTPGFDYWRVHVEDCPLFPATRGRAKTTAVKRSTVVMVCALGRPLGAGEVVHHIDHGTEDDRLENLEVMTRGQHTRHHHVGKRRTKLTKSRMSAAVKAQYRTGGRVQIHTIGMKNGHAKLNPDKVRHIRKKEMPQKEYAELYGVVQSIISQAQRGIIWKSVK